MLREGKPLQKTIGPPGWGFSVGRITPPCKNYLVTETATMNSNPQGSMKISSQATELGSMTDPSENPSREDPVEKKHCCGPMPGGNKNR